MKRAAISRASRKELFQHHHRSPRGDLSFTKPMRAYQSRIQMLVLRLRLALVKGGGTQKKTPTGPLLLGRESSPRLIPAPQKPIHLESHLRLSHSLPRQAN